MKVLKEFLESGHIDKYEVHYETNGFDVKVYKTMRFDNMTYSECYAFEFVERGDTQYTYTITSMTGTRSVTHCTGYMIAGCNNDNYIIDRNDVPDVIEKKIKELIKWCGW